MEGHVHTHLDPNGIATLEFFHPAHNSLPGYLLKEIVEEINLLSEDANCQVIILKSGGDRTFCAGASFDELRSIQDPKEGKEFFSGFANVINAIRKCKKLIIGRVQGKAVGGGVGIAAAVDYCFASKYASIKLSELGIGIGPFVIGPAVERKIGLSSFSQLSLDFTSFYSPEWAHSKGLYMQVFDTADEMDKAVKAFASKLSTTNPEARHEMKKMFWNGTEHWDDLLLERAKISGKLVLSEFTKDKIEKIK